jgi:hypothetical protein
MPEDKTLTVLESKVREAMEACPEVKKTLATIFGDQLTPEMPEMKSGMVWERDSTPFMGKLYLSVSASINGGAHDPPFVMGVIDKYGGVWKDPQTPEQLYADGFKPFTGKIYLSVRDGEIVDFRKI